MGSCVSRSIVACGARRRRSCLLLIFALRLLALGLNGAANSVLEQTSERIYIRTRTRTRARTRVIDDECTVERCVVTWLTTKCSRSRAATRVDVMASGHRTG